MTEVQKIILEIFKEVSAICEKHGLRYFAIGGTCIGAVRPKGFIPWDDDMDIAMPIEDYIKFIELCKTELPEHLELFSQETVPHDPLPFIKVIDNRTMMTEEEFLLWKDTFEGVWLDIMPLPGIPGKDSEKKLFVAKAKLLKRFLRHTKGSFPTKGRLRGKIFWLLVLPLRLISHDYFWNVWLNFLKNHPFDKGKYTGYVWSGNFAQLIFPMEWFEDFVMLPFEDTEMRCPKGYHEYLTQHFGDYMLFPPKEEQVLRHTSKGAVIDLSHSYKDYQSGKLPLPELNKEEK